MEAKELHELAKSVCAVLPGFEYVDDGRQRDRDGNLWGHAHLTALAGAEPGNRPLQVYFSNSRDNVRGKVRVSLDMPHVPLGGRKVWLGDSLPYKKTPACVHVSGARAPLAIAREIERRLLPDARAQWSRALAWLADREACQGEQDGVRGQLVAMGASFSPTEPARGWFMVADGSYVGLRVSGRSVAFERLSVDAGHACAILQRLRG
jgi:hypothetical protein